MFLIHLHAGVGHPVSAVALVLAGLLIGVVAGMFGVGGGFLLTPLLLYGFGIPPPMAVGSALCQQCGTAIASFLKYRRLGRGEPYIDLMMMGGSLLGVDAGGRLLNHLNHLAPLHLSSGRDVPLLTLIINALFVAMLAGVAIYMTVEVRAARGRPQRQGDVSIAGPLVTKVHIPPHVDLPHVGLK
jgi:uncharacterized membrane protein YfcA